MLKVLNLSADVLKNVPDVIDYEATANLVADDMSPLNVVLLQEVRIDLFSFRPGHFILTI